MIEIHVHQSPSLDLKIGEISNKLEDIDKRLDDLHNILVETRRIQRRIMASQEELLTELGEINRTTDELALDVQDMITKMGQAEDPAQKEEIKAQLVALKGKLQGIAAQHEPNPAVADPTDPNVTGKARRTVVKEEPKPNPFPLDPPPNPFDK